MVRVALIGAAGGIGQPLALLLKTQLPFGSILTLFDVIPTAGIAADLSHINSFVKLENYENIDDAVKGADVVIIAAGKPRQPGMTRQDLFVANAKILQSIIDAVNRGSPKAIIGIITNPVNSTVPLAEKILGSNFHPNRLFGISTLDVVRAQTFIGEMKGLDSSKIHVDVIGGHSPETMIPVLSQVKGVTFTEEELKKLTDRIKNAGTEVVEAKKGNGSATLSMAYAAARFTDAVVRGLHGEHPIECAYVKVQGMETDYFAVPVEFGKEGVSKIHPLPPLSDFEQKQYKEAVDVLKQNISEAYSTKL